MSPRRHWPSLAIPVVVGMLAGCSIGNGPVSLRKFERPAGNAPLSDDTWDEAAANADKSSFQVRYWLLPTWCSGRRVAVSPEGDSLSDSEFAYFDLGLVILPFLPLWISNESQLHRKSGESATSSVVWTPVYTGWETAGWPTDEPAVRAWGFPLLYSGIDYARLGDQPMFEWSATLWTLGPSWTRFDFDVGSEHAEGWTFLPVMLAGFGSLLWTSTEWESTSLEASAHGPLFGLLGYKAETDHVEHESTRKVVAGILWYDTEESYADGEVFDARHGPLWGMFGWGVSDGEPGLRIFWLPIAIG